MTKNHLRSPRLFYPFGHRSVRTRTPSGYQFIMVSITINVLHKIFSKVGFIHLLYFGYSILMCLLLQHPDDGPRDEDWDSSRRSILVDVSAMTPHSDRGF